MQAGELQQFTQRIDKDIIVDLNCIGESDVPSGVLGISHAKAATVANAKTQWKAWMGEASMDGFTAIRKQSRHPERTNRTDVTHLHPTPPKPAELCPPCWS